ncbi:hypothetical protein FPOAC2_10383 [Fusarium poae]|uniref:uncharacterized protein n=1 Tax=Fusarium poae TaxID=36050 RepID=UPI001D03D5D1|nr:uncharacterized protein FPOAC1_013459 [Fusarium poae]KAG8664679.1 hypothetical protein FPOAC1_013459 [Fusarium poae]
MSNSYAGGTNCMLEDTREAALVTPSQMSSCGSLDASLAGVHSHAEDKFRWAAVVITETERIMPITLTQFIQRRETHQNGLDTLANGAVPDMFASDKVVLYIPTTPAVLAWISSDIGKTVVASCRSIWVDAILTPRFTKGKAGATKQTDPMEAVNQISFLTWDRETAWETVEDLDGSLLVRRACESDGPRCSSEVFGPHRVVRALRNAGFRRGRFVLTVTDACHDGIWRHEQRPWTESEPDSRAGFLKLMTQVGELDVDAIDFASVPRGPSRNGELRGWAEAATSKLRVSLVHVAVAKIVTLTRWVATRHECMHTEDRPTLADLESGTRARLDDLHTRIQDMEGQVTTVGSRLRRARGALLRNERKYCLLKERRLPPGRIDVDIRHIHGQKVALESMLPGLKRIQEYECCPILANAADTIAVAVCAACRLADDIAGLFDVYRDIETSGVSMGKNGGAQEIADLTGKTVNVFYLKGLDGSPKPGPVRQLHPRRRGAQGSKGESCVT